jgi:hypothetical protein
MNMQTVVLKIHELDSFKALIEALAQWAGEMEGRDQLTPAEDALLRAAVDLSDRSTPATPDA